VGTQVSPRDVVMVRASRESRTMSLVPVTAHK